MAIGNHSFEEPGSRPGAAAGWRLTSSAALWRFAGFGDPVYGFEGFGWGRTRAELSAEVLSPAVFDTPGEIVEDFFEGWIDGGDVYLFAWDDGVAEVATFAEGGGLVETFSAGWLVEGYLYGWDDLDPGDVDASDLADVDVDGYFFAWADIDAAAADFTGESVEDFSAWG